MSVLWAWLLGCHLHKLHKWFNNPMNFLGFSMSASIIYEFMHANKGVCMPKRKVATRPKATPKKTQRRVDAPSPSVTNEAANYSRSSASARYSDARHSRRRKGILRGFLIVLLSFVVIGGTVAFAYAMNISSKLNEGIDSALRGQLTEVTGGDPFYMLLIGVDKNQDRVNSAEYGADDSAYRTDSILLARVDPTEKKVTLVSIHRDTLVDLGSNGKEKINAAYSIGGAAYTVEVISEFAGVPISHYAEIDFDQFCSVVDTIGGIEVNVAIDCIDPEYTGADIKAGVQTLNGDNALKLCRARHAYDDLGDGDVYRAANQRMVIGAILKKILTLDVASMTSTISTIAESVSTDLSLTDILSLANSFRDFDFDNNLLSGMEPTNSKYVNDTWYEICDTAAWQAMMVRVNQGLSPYSDESQDPTGGILDATNVTNSDDDSSDSDSDSDSTTSADKEYSGTVEVLNGVGVEGLAGRISYTLSNQGFDTWAGNADSLDYSKTRIIYVGSENQAKAKAVADVLGLSNVVADDGTYAGEAEVVVVLGEDMVNN